MTATRARLIEQVLEREGPGCAYCGVWVLIPSNVEWRGDYIEPDPSPDRPIRPYLRLITEVRTLHLDHALPRSRGGSDHAENMRLSCPPCNIDKGTMNEWEYLLALPA